MRTVLVFAFVITSMGSARAEETRRLDASIINYFPQGAKTVLILRRGARDGVSVGLVWSCRDGRYLCKTTEVYEFRSKCLTPVEGAELGEPHRCSADVPAALQRFEATVLATVPEEDATTFVLDKGHVHGVGFADRVDIQGRSCSVWRIERERAMCAVTPAWSGAPPTTADVRTVSLPPSTPVHEPKLAPPQAPPPPRASAVGVRESAPPVMLTRARGHGLLASHACVGFTADEKAAYLLSSATGVAPLPDEKGLVIERLDLRSGVSVEVARLRPDRVAEGTNALGELIAREGLLACHAAVPRTRGAVSEYTAPKAWVAAHGADAIAFWFEPETQSVYAAMDDGRVAAERVGSTQKDLVGVWFLPGNPHHVVHTDRWLAVTVGQ